MSDEDARGEHNESAEFGPPELTLLRRGDGPDSRLVELVRLLARRGARQWYDQSVKKRRLKL